MARKSRKLNSMVDVPQLKSSLIQVAAYVRLSLEDRSRKATSIENQQLIITSYIDEHSNFELYDTYIDSGVSGTTFERAGFQRMLRDAEAGVISCIIVKDLSRLGRNAIDAGYYAEKIFPSLGVRLISITDNYDSATDSGSIALPLTNLVNETYALDISRKTRSQKRQAMKDGVFVGGRPPYGYKRSPEDRHKLITDTHAAEIVIQIFTWASEGVSTHEIVKRLNTSNIPSPVSHISGSSSTSEANPLTIGRWYPRTVKRILENELYTGRLVQGKTRRINFVQKPAPADEWVHYDEAHEAIVPAVLFQAVQDLRNESTAGFQNDFRTAGSPNMFKSKIFCAHCGGYLERKKNHDKYVYLCVTNRITPNSCVGNHIREDDVKIAVLEQLIQYKDQVYNDANMPSNEQDIVNELQFVDMELTYTQGIVRSLYENLINRVLNETEYMELKSDYQEKTDTLEQRAEELSQKLSNAKRERAVLQKSLSILDGLAETRVLTKEHIDRFVERIEVFKNGRVYVGVRMQMERLI